MQLDKAIKYHKAMADPTRLRILILLSKGEMSGQELAELLNVSPPTVTHHAAKLREAALLHERREKNTIFFKLNEYFIRQYAQRTVEMILGRHKEEEIDEMDTETKNKKLQEAVLNNFFTKDGRLKQIPSQYKKKLIALEHLVKQLEHGRKYTEKVLVNGSDKMLCGR